MSTDQVKPYSIAQFIEDVEREFHFLVEEYGFVEESSQWTSHDGSFGFAEHVATGLPRVIYQGTMRRVVVAHDPRGAVEVHVTRMYPEIRSSNLEEIAREAGSSKPEQYGEIYDMTQRTAGERIRKLAEGLRIHGVKWITSPEAP